LKTTCAPILDLPFGKYRKQVAGIIMVNLVGEEGFGMLYMKIIEKY
jgi:hypothetical protein